MKTRTCHRQPRYFVTGCLVAVLSALPLLTGCSSSEPPPDRPETAPVTGTVMYQGEPVEGATVVFTPAGSQATGAVAKTDASGKFELMTYEPGDGAIPGKYQVS
ncbi:MAG: hypothetical protein ACF8TS_18945, partial [Maioricimonas sp. JB049]